MISILVPFYNSSETLDETINSILNQSYKNFELLLLNDGSTDNSISICKKYKDERIKIFNLKHQGVSKTLNFGLKKSKGNYISIIDSDDIVNELYLEIMLYQIKKYKADIVECGIDLFKETIPDTNTKIKKTIINKEEMFKRLYSNNGLRTSIIRNKLFRKDIFKNIVFDSEVCEDEFIIHKLINNSKRIVIIDNSLYYYRIRDNSRQRTFNKKRLKVLDVFKERENYLPKSLLLRNKIAYYDLIIYLYIVSSKYKEKLLTKELHNIFINNYYYNKEYGLLKNTKYLIFKYFPNIIKILTIHKKRYKYV